MSDYSESLDESVNDGNDDLLLPAQSTTRRNRKSTAGTRKIQHVWNDKEIERLLFSVENHRGLWDIDSAEYKLSKLSAWQSVVEELGIDGVNVNEAKAKWASLRTTYMVNLSNWRKRGGHQRCKPNWRFFEALLFLQKVEKEITKSKHETKPLQKQEIFVQDFKDISTCDKNYAANNDSIDTIEDEYYSEVEPCIKDDHQSSASCATPRPPQAVNSMEDFKKYISLALAQIEDEQILKKVQYEIKLALSAAITEDAKNHLSKMSTGNVEKFRK